MALLVRTVATFGISVAEMAGFPVTCTIVKILAGKLDEGSDRGFPRVLLLIEVGGRGNWRLPELPMALKA